MCRDDKMDKENVILFGASNFGERVLEYLDDKYKVIYFCDNDSAKIGTLFNGIRVISPNNLLEIMNKENAKIMITSSFFMEIAIQLSNMGIDSCYITFLKTSYDPIAKKWSAKLNIENYKISRIRSLQIEENSIGLVVRNNSGSNTLALWKMIPQYILDKYNVKLIYEKKNIIEYYEELYSCKVVVTTHSNNLYFLNPNDRKYIQLWHGFILKGLGLMDKCVPLSRKKNVDDWKRYDVVTSYSLMYSSLINACFGGNTHLYRITGAPRNDFLFKSDGRKLLSNLLNIELHDKKILFFMPTFRSNFYTQYISGNKSWENIFGFKEFDNKEFSYFLQKNNIVLILKMHPYEELFVSEIIKNQDIKNTFLIFDDTLEKSKIDSYEIINACDLLITDYSSIYFDFLLLDRPIIFTPIDLDEYIENAGMLYGPYEYWTPGPKVLDQETLQEEILKNINGKDEYSNQRNVIRNIVHHYKDANSSSRVWNVIEEVLKQESKVKKLDKKGY